jgi:septal ring-binding cell division protein DamX
MKTKNSIIIIVSFFLALVIYSCNSTGYEIETIENNDPTVNTDNSAGKQLVQPAIEDTIPANMSDSQNKDLPNNLYKIFTIQIGAFSNSDFANTYTEKAKRVLNLEIISTFDNGLYKIKTGTFNNIKDASLALEKIKSQGYTDSFITGSK